MSDLVQIMPAVVPAHLEQPDLNIEYWRRTIADRIKQAIHQQAIDAADDGFRSHLGASAIGAECARHLYYHFFWFKKEVHSARMERLFAQGHKFEAEMRAAMKAGGAEFLDGLDETGKQLRFSDLDGHFGGSCDGIFRWPDIGIYEPTLLECKTSKTGAPFTELFKKGVIGSKHQHFAQQSTYGKAWNIKFAAYVAYNKNDSDIYVEVVDLSHQLGEEMRERAASIISAKFPPKRIARSATHFVCKMCPHHLVCWTDEPIVPNCRNCAHSSPAANAEWHCAKFNDVIPKDFLPKGCPEHELKPR